MKNLSVFTLAITGAYFAVACSTNSPGLFDKAFHDDAQNATIVTAGTAGTINSINVNSGPEILQDTTLRSLKDTAAANFMAYAAIGGMKEVEMGTVAQQRATNARVKAFAAMMVKDHTQQNSELKQIAAAKKVNLAEATAGHQGHQMADNKGRGFDWDYILMMVGDHEKTLRLFERARSNVKDPQVKAFVVKYLPVIQMHRDSARAIYGHLRPHNQ